LEFDSKKSITALLGAFMDTEANGGAKGARTEILQKIGHTLTMQPAVVPSNLKRMTGILMGTETLDQHGVPMFSLSLMSWCLTQGCPTALSLQAASWKLTMVLSFELH